MKIVNCTAITSKFTDKRKKDWPPFRRLRSFNYLFGRYGNCVVNLSTITVTQHYKHAQFHTTLTHLVGI